MRQGRDRPPGWGQTGRQALGTMSKPQLTPRESIRGGIEPHFSHHLVTKDLRLDPPLSLSTWPRPWAWVPSKGLVPGHCSKCARRGPGCPPRASVEWGSQESRRCLLRTRSQVQEGGETVARAQLHQHAGGLPESWGALGGRLDLDWAGQSPRGLLRRSPSGS